jgi:single-strand DNA-binding protein
MSTRSLNKVMLIGNLTRDPNLRFTPNGTAICSFGIATNRSWAPADGGERVEKAEFHNIVAWSKLAEICGQLLHKGDKVYVDGRIQNREWKTDEGEDKRITEIVIDNMMLLNSRSNSGGGGGYQNERYDRPAEDNGGSSKSAKKGNDQSDQGNTSDEVADAEDISDDIPF